MVKSFYKTKPQFNALVMHRVVESKKEQFIDIRLNDFQRLLSENSRYSFRSIESMRKRGASAKHDICLTFDDGFSSDFKYVLPELKKISATATFFITTNWLNLPGYVSVEELQIMANEGMEIGSHSVSHPDFSQLSIHEIEHELSASKELLESILKRPILAFSFPFGGSSQAAFEAVFSAGYSVCCTSRHGTTSFDSCVVNRNSINANTSFMRVKKICDASVLQRLSWRAEDQIKAFLKRYAPRLYLFLRNNLSSL